MKSFGSLTTGDDSPAVPVRIPVVSRIPTDYAAGDLIWKHVGGGRYDLSISAVNKDVGVQADPADFVSFARDGDSRMVSSVLRGNKTVYRGVMTKLPMSLVRHTSGLVISDAGASAGSFVNTAAPGVFEVIGVATHDAVDGTLFVCRDKEIIGMAHVPNPNGDIITTTVYAHERIATGEIVSLYFQTSDKSATVYNDKLNSKMVVKQTSDLSRERRDAQFQR